MTNETQIKFVADRLKKTGKVSRNECLANYITRLGAIIKRLEERGWHFQTELCSSGTHYRNGKYEKTKHGVDYVYYLERLPEKK